MNPWINNFRDLWRDSVWFRVCSAIVCIGILMLARTLASKPMGNSRSGIAASQAADQVQGILDEGGLSLTPQQQAIVQKGIDSLTPDQRQKYQQMLDQLQPSP